MLRKQTKTPNTHMIVFTLEKKGHVWLLTHNIYIHIKNSCVYLSHSLQTTLSKHRSKALLEQMSSLLRIPHNLGILITN